MESKSKIRIAIIGSLPPPLGGVRVLTKQLIDDLDKREDIDLVFVNISAHNKTQFSKIKAFLKSLKEVISKFFWVDVLVIGARAPYDLVYGLLSMPFLKAGNKRLIIRKFGGNFDLTYNELNFVYRWLYNIILFKADLWLFETKHLVSEFSAKIRNAKWYPNNRRIYNTDGLTAKKPSSCRNFVYLGHVRSAKGIAEIIEAGERFAGSDVSIDIYGTLRHDISAEDFKDLKKVRYCGTVAPEKVLDIISQYDAFLLPTYYRGEGYPGTILEAYSAGLPIICTRWRALTEIVDDNSGILIESHDANALYEAMQRLIDDDALYARLQKGAKKKREEFSSEVWTEKFVEYCEELFQRSN